MLLHLEVHLQYKHGCHYFYHSLDIDSKGKGLETHHVHQCFQQLVCHHPTYDLILLIYDLILLVKRSFVVF